MPWIEVSYRVGHPIMVGSTEVIRGTAGLSDVLAWPGVATGSYYGELWRESEQLALTHHPEAFVGHSLGATYAKDLASKGAKPYRGFGRPGLGAMSSGDVANLGDPVSWGLWGSKRAALGHSTSSYY